MITIGSGITEVDFTDATTCSPMIANGNGDFEMPVLGPPYSSNLNNVPGWVHSGSPGDDLLWAVGYFDQGGSITTAGHGKQFVTMGGGFFGFGSARWSTTMTGLAPGGVSI